MSGNYRKLVTSYGMIQSVGRTGVCWDNAVAESAWSSLKRELVHRYRFTTRADARRRHSAIAYLHPGDLHAGTTAPIIAARQNVLGIAYPDRFRRRPLQAATPPTEAWINNLAVQTKT